MLLPLRAGHWRVTPAESPPPNKKTNKIPQKIMIDRKWGQTKL